MGALPGVKGGVVRGSAWGGWHLQDHVPGGFSAYSPFLTPCSWKQGALLNDRSRYTVPPLRKGNKSEGTNEWMNKKTLKTSSHPMGEAGMHWVSSRANTICDLQAAVALSPAIPKMLLKFQPHSTPLVSWAWKAGHRGASLPFSLLCLGCSSFLFSGWRAPPSPAGVTSDVPLSAWPPWRDTGVPGLLPALCL